MDQSENVVFKTNFMQFWCTIGELENYNNLYDRNRDETLYQYLYFFITFLKLSVNRFIV